MVVPFRPVGNRSSVTLYVPVPNFTVVPFIEPGNDEADELLVPDTLNLNLPGVGQAVPEPGGHFTTFFTVSVEFPGGHTLSPGHLGPVVPPGGQDGEPGVHVGTRGTVVEVVVEVEDPGVADTQVMAYATLMMAIESLGSFGTPKNVNTFCFRSATFVGSSSTFMSSSLFKGSFTFCASLADVMTNIILSQCWIFFVGQTLKLVTGACAFTFGEICAGTVKPVAANTAINVNA